ncbi:MAG: hypothetical protein SNJ77_01195 [Cytophagales bacterium]
MDRKNFLEFVKHPENVSFEDAGVLEDLAEQYPFCQSIFALQLIQSYNTLPNVYQTLLPEVSLKTSDRANLRHLLQIYSEKKNKQNL